MAKMSKFEIKQDENYKSILVDGVVQSAIPLNENVPIHTNGSYNFLVPKINPKTVLILGFGGGQIATELLKRFPDIQITGVDNSEDMINFSKKQYEGKNITLFLDDAYNFISHDNNKYGHILVHLYQGAYFHTESVRGAFFNLCFNHLLPSGELCYLIPNIEKMIEKHFLQGKLYNQDDIVLTYKFI